MMTTKKRLLSIVAAAVACVAVAITSLWHFWLPGYVEAAIREAARARGLAVEGLRVARVSLHGLDITGLRMGPGARLTAETISVTYDLAALRARRVRAITVDGAHFELDMPTLASGDSPVAWPSHGGIASNGLLPFERLDIRSAEIVVRATSENTLRAVLDASLAAHEDGTENLDVTGDLLGQPIHITGERRAGVIDVVLSPLRWEFGEREPLSELVSSMMGARPVGLIVIEGRVRIAGGRVDGQLSVRTDALGLNAASGIWSVAGIACDLGLDGISPPRTRGAQTITWASARAGRAEIGGGRIVFAFETPSDVRIEDAGVRIGRNGQIAIAPFTFDMSHPNLALSVTATQLALEDWLELASGGRASGVGELSGHVTLRVRTQPRLRVDVLSGSFHSREGQLRVRDTAALRRLLDSQAATQGEAEIPGLDVGVMERVAASLKDFLYSALDVELVPRGEDLALRTHLVGRGRANAQEIDLNLNVNGFDALVDMAVSMELGMGHAAR